MERETTIQELETLYNTASELAGQERRKFLDEACAGRPALRRQLEEMLSTDTEFLSESLLTQALRAETVTQIGRWRVKEQIGEGGLGLVYRAETSNDGVTIEAAVKILRPGFDSGLFRGRFQQERQILANLSHPGIARFMDCGADESGRSFLAMEFVPGELLTDVLEKRPLSRDEKVERFSSIVEAVQYLHSRLIVHGDIKPGNVMVTPEGATKLLDFGTARLLGADTAPTEMTRLMLTPHYASPEQKRGEGPSVPSDIYSLGRLFHEMLGAEEVREPDLQAIVQRCVAEEPAARYPSAGSLIEDLQRWRTGYPVHARRQTLFYAVTRFARRQWHVVGLTTLLIVTLAAGLVNSLRSAENARRLAAEAQRSAEEARRSAAESIRQTELARSSAEESDRQRTRAESATTEAVDSATRYRRLLAQMLDEDEGTQKTGPAGEASVVLERGFAVLINQMEKARETTSLEELSGAWRRLGSLQCKRGDYPHGIDSLRKAIGYADQWMARAPSADSRAAAVISRVFLIQHLLIRKDAAAARAMGSDTIVLIENLPPAERNALEEMPIYQWVQVMVSERVYGEERVIRAMNTVRQKASRGLQGFRVRIGAVTRLIDIYSKRGMKEQLPSLCEEAVELLIAEPPVRHACFGPDGDLPLRTPIMNQLLTELGADDQSYNRKLRVAEISIRLATALWANGAQREARSALNLAEKALSELSAVDPNGPAVTDLRRRIASMRRFAQKASVRKNP